MVEDDDSNRGSAPWSDDKVSSNPTTVRERGFGDGDAGGILKRGLNERKKFRDCSPRMLDREGDGAVKGVLVLFAYKRD